VSATAKNLEAIHAAIIRHAQKCGAAVLEIRMSPFEVDRLDFDRYLDIPIVGDADLGTGRFRLVCADGHGEAPGASAVAKQDLGVTALADRQDLLVVPVDAVQIFGQGGESVTPILRLVGDGPLVAIGVGLHRPAVVVEPPHDVRRSDQVITIRGEHELKLEVEFLHESSLDRQAA
jgi:hypothetical protein